MRAKELIANATGKLEAAGSSDAEREVIFLLSSIMDCDTCGCYLAENISDEFARKFFSSLERRINGEPLQLIIGEWEFFGRPISIREGVFIPRPETEGLVQLILDRTALEEELYGLEIGIGSGAICANLLAERPDLRMVGTDISPKAIELTAENARKLGVSDRLKLIHTNVANGISGSFGFVVSNPPYVLTSELENLPIEVKADPKTALDGGEDGLDIIREIIDCEPLIKPGGLIALEIHEDSGSRILELLSETFIDAEIIRDLYGAERYAIAFKGK